MSKFFPLNRDTMLNLDAVAMAVRQADGSLVLVVPGLQPIGIPILGAREVLEALGITDDGEPVDPSVPSALPPASPHTDQPRCGLCGKIVNEELRKLKATWVCEHDPAAAEA